MDRGNEAQKILLAIKENHFVLRNHAIKRAADRVLSHQHGGFTAAIDGDVWIVTIFKRKLTRREKELVK